MALRTTLATGAAHVHKTSMKSVKVSLPATVNTQMTTDELEYLVPLTELGEDSDIVGTVTVPATYRDTEQVLTTRFPNLKINKSKTFVRFIDPVVRDIILQNVAHANPDGLSEEEAATVTSIYGWWNEGSSSSPTNGAEIEYLDLSVFPNLTRLSKVSDLIGEAYGNTSIFATTTLKWLNTGNVVALERSFASNTQLEELYIPNVTMMKVGGIWGGWFWAGTCTTLKKLYVTSQEQWLTIVRNTTYKDCSPGAYNEYTLYLISDPDTPLVDFDTSGVSQIQPYTFYNYKLLKSCPIHSGITHIGNGAFFHCEQLTGKLEIPSGCTVDDTETFGYTGFNEVVCSDAMTRISQQTFGYMPNLQKVDLGGVTEIVNQSSFAACTQLEEIIIRHPIYSHGRYTFRNDRNIKKVLVPDLETWLRCRFGDSEATPFYSPSAKLYLLSNPNVPLENVDVDLTGIVEDTLDMKFYGCTWVRSVKIPDTITTLGRYAFVGFDLGSLPESVINVPDRYPAFDTTLQTNQLANTSWFIYQGSGSKQVGAKNESTQFYDFNNGVLTIKTKGVYDSCFLRNPYITKVQSTILERFHGDSIWAYEPNLEYFDCPNAWCDDVGGNYFQSSDKLKSIRFAGLVTTTLGTGEYIFCNNKSLRRVEFCKACDIGGGSTCPNYNAAHNRYPNNAVLTEVLLPDDLCTIANPLCVSPNVNFYVSSQAKIAEYLAYSNWSQIGAARFKLKSTLAAI